jgi:hypothetical protein
MDGGSSGATKKEDSMLELFIAHLASIIKDYIAERVDRIVADPFILLHTVSELTSFVAAVREKTGVDCSSITDAFFGPNLPAWIAAEREAADGSLSAILHESEPWEKVALQSPQSVAGSVCSFIALVDDLVKTLHTIPSNSAKVDFLEAVIVPLFNRVFERIEFEVPAFYANRKDVCVLILQANSLSQLVGHIETRWGESMVRTRPLPLGLGNNIARMLCCWQRVKISRKGLAMMQLSCPERYSTSCWWPLNAF